MAVDITEDGDCEEISIDGNPSMNYRSVEDFDDFKQYICDTYNVDTIEEMEAGATIVNCGADADTSIALQEALKDFKGIDSIDVKKLLPIVAQNKGIIKKGEKVLLKVMGNCFAVKCDGEGIATVSKNKVSNEAVELDGSDFAFLYFFQTKGSGISEEEIAKYQNEMAKIKAEAKTEVEIAKKTAQNEIVALEKKYAAIVEEHAAYKKIIDAMKAEEQKKSGKFTNLGIGDIVKFGKYIQDNTGVKKEIEWQVLDVEEKKVLLISKYALEIAQFGDEWEWSECNLRSWLNGVFFKTAFSGEEAKQIAVTNVEKNVSDKLFLLSQKEVRKYLITDNSRICLKTDFIKNDRYRLAFYGTVGSELKNCYWWLRDTVEARRLISIVDTNGSIAYGVCDDSLCVRPAMWVNI